MSTSQEWVGFGDPGHEAPFFDSNLAVHMLDLMGATHERQRASAFAGVVGVGKSRVVTEFAQTMGDEVIVVTVKGKNMRATEALYIVVKRLRGLLGDPPLKKVQGKATLKRALEDLLERWWLMVALAEPHRSGRNSIRRTLIFDEAQNLHPDSIAQLRFCNDAHEPDAHPIGLIFVGNDEFSLRVYDDGTSPLSLAVADRMLFMENYQYKHVTDDDVTNYIKAFGVVEKEAVKRLVKHLDQLLPKLHKTPQRSYRNVNKLLDQLQLAADGGPLDATAFDKAFWDTGKLSGAAAADEAVL